MNTWRMTALFFLLALTLPACSDDGGSATPDAGVDVSVADGAPRPDGAAPDATAPDLGPPLKHEKEVDDLVRPIMDGKWTVGLVVGLISQEGQEIHVYGETAAGAGPPTEDTLFEIGSITKTFTSLLLAQEVKDGKVTLAQPVQELLPAAKVTVPQLNGKQITLLHLSTHTSGLPRMPGNVDVADPKALAAYTADKLYAFLNGYTLTREPGAGWEYSNLAVGLLGHALTLEAGKGYEALVIERITTPLALGDTVITLSAAQKSRLAQGHNYDLEEADPIDIGVMAPAGEIRSTARDMLAYLAAQAGLTSTSLDAEMAETHKTHYAGPPAMGLAWIISDGRYRWHNGGTGGFETYAGFDTQAKVGVVVLGNAITAWQPQTQLGNELLRMMAGQSFKPVNIPKTISVPTATLDQYVGSYENATKTLAASITRKGDHLYLDLKDQPSFRMYAQTSETFYIRADQLGLAFQKDATGEYSSLLLTTTSGKVLLSRAS